MQHLSDVHGKPDQLRQGTVDTSTSRIRIANSEIVGKGNLDAIKDYFAPDFAPDFVAHGTAQDMKGGHAAIRRFVVGLWKAFPDLQIDVEILVESGERDAWQRTYTANHKGGYHGFPATGRERVWRDIMVSRFHGGLIAEGWVLSDLAESLLLARKH